MYKRKHYSSNKSQQCSSDNHFTVKNVTESAEGMLMWALSLIFWLIVIVAAFVAPSVAFMGLGLYILYKILGNI